MREFIKQKYRHGIAILMAFVLLFGAAGWHISADEADAYGSGYAAFLEDGAVIAGEGSAGDCEDCTEYEDCGKIEGGPVPNPPSVCEVCTEDEQCEECAEEGGTDGGDYSPGQTDCEYCTEDEQCEECAEEGDTGGGEPCGNYPGLEECEFCTEDEQCEDCIEYECEYCTEDEQCEECAEYECEFCTEDELCEECAEYECEYCTEDEKCEECAEDEGSGGAVVPPAVVFEMESYTVYLTALDDIIHPELFVLAGVRAFDENGGPVPVFIYNSGGLLLPDGGFNLEDLMPGAEFTVIYMATHPEGAEFFAWREFVLPALVEHELTFVFEEGEDGVEISDIHSILEPMLFLREGVSVWDENDEPVDFIVLCTERLLLEDGSFNLDAMLPGAEFAVTYMATHPLSGQDFPAQRMFFISTFKPHELTFIFEEGEWGVTLENLHEAADPMRFIREGVSVLDENDIPVEFEVADTGFLLLEDGSFNLNDMLPGMEFFVAYSAVHPVSREEHFAVRVFYVPLQIAMLMADEEIRSASPGFTVYPGQTVTITDGGIVTGDIIVLAVPDTAPRSVTMPVSMITPMGFASEGYDIDDEESADGESVNEVMRTVVVISETGERANSGGTLIIENSGRVVGDIIVHGELNGPSGSVEINADHRDIPGAALTAVGITVLGAVDIQGGVAYFNSGVIAAPHTLTGARVVINQGGTFNMSGGVNLENNSISDSVIRALNHDQGIFGVDLHSGVFNMSGGRIVGPRTNFPAVRVDDPISHFNMTGGFISGDRHHLGMNNASDNVGTFGVMVVNGNFKLGEEEASGGPAGVNGPAIVGYTAQNRPAVDMQVGTLNMYNGTILVGRLDVVGINTVAINNRLNPTGVWVQGGVTVFNMKGGEIRGRLDDPPNTYRRSGTGVRVQGTFNFSNGEIYNLRRGVLVDGTGAALSMSGGEIRNNLNITTSTNLNYVRTSAGAGVNVTNNGLFTMSSGRIHSNRAGVGAGVNVINGGSFIMSGGGYTIIPGEYGRWEPCPNNDWPTDACQHRPGGCDICGVNNPPRPGEIYIPGTDTMYIRNADPVIGDMNATLTDAPFTGDTGYSALNVNLGVQINAPQGNISTFNGDDGGGGVRVFGAGSTFVMRSGYIIGNYAGNFFNRPDTARNHQPHNNEGGVGGGVLVMEGATFTIRDGGTEAPAEKGGTISFNTAFRRQDGPGAASVRAGGGGVAVIGPATWTVSVRRQNPTVFNMEAGVIERNFARLTGGGVAVRSTPTDAGDFLNAAANNTQRIGENDVIFNMTGGEIRYNIVDNNFRRMGSHGAGYYQGGGGVFVQGANAEFILGARRILHPTHPATQPGTLSGPIGDPVIHGNEARGDNHCGGGVQLVGFSDFFMRGGTISNNVAGSLREFWSGALGRLPSGGWFTGGGGIGSRNQAWLFISGGLITGNSAATGGGIYLDNWSRMWIGHATNPDGSPNADGVPHPDGPAVAWPGGPGHSDRRQEGGLPDLAPNFYHHHQLGSRTDNDISRFENVAVRIIGNHAYGRQFGVGRDGRGGGAIALGDGSWGNALLYSANRGLDSRSLGHLGMHIFSGTLITNNTSGGDAGGIYFWAIGANEADNTFLLPIRVDPGAYLAGNFSYRGGSMNDFFHAFNTVRARETAPAGAQYNLPSTPRNLQRMTNGQLLIGRNEIINPAPWPAFRDQVPRPPSMNPFYTVRAPDIAEWGLHSFNNHDMRTFGDGSFEWNPDVVPPEPQAPTSAEPSEVHVRVDAPRGMGTIEVRVEFEGENNARIPARNAEGRLLTREATPEELQERPEWNGRPQYDLRPVFRDDDYSGILEDERGQRGIPEIPSIVIHSGTPVTNNPPTHSDKGGPSRRDFRRVEGRDVTASLVITASEPDWFRVSEINVYAICLCMEVFLDAENGNGALPPRSLDGSSFTIPHGHRYSNGNTINWPYRFSPPYANNNGRPEAPNSPAYKRPCTVNNISIDLTDPYSDFHSIIEGGIPLPIFSHTFAFPTINFPFPVRPSWGPYRMFIEVVIEPRPFDDVDFNITGHTLDFGTHGIVDFLNHGRPLRLGEQTGAPEECRNCIEAVVCAECDEGTVDPHCGDCIAAVVCAECAEDEGIPVFSGVDNSMGFTVFNGSGTAEWSVTVEAEGIGNDVLSRRLLIMGGNNTPMHLQEDAVDIFAYPRDALILWPEDENGYNGEGRVSAEPAPALLTHVTWRDLQYLGRDIRVSTHDNDGALLSGGHQAVITWALFSGNVPTYPRGNIPGSVETFSQTPHPDAGDAGTRVPAQPRTPGYPTAMNTAPQERRRGLRRRNIGL